MLRRRPRAAARFAAKDEPVPVSSNEYATLKQISLGGVGNLAMRERLVSKGLISSKIGSKCALTRKGKITLSARP